MTQRIPENLFPIDWSLVAVIAMPPRDPDDEDDEDEDEDEESDDEREPPVVREPDEDQ